MGLCKGLLKIDRKGEEKIMNYKDHYPSTEKNLDEFLCLPRKAQLLWFDYLMYVTFTNKKHNAYEVNSFTTEGVESPIENIFYTAFNILTFEEDDFNKIYLYPQYPISVGSKNYIIDFAIMYFDENTGNEKVLLLVECDGHDYHSTKKQIKNDNEKDMNLKLAGYEIARFNGSQLYKEPYDCVYNALLLAKKFI